LHCLQTTVTNNQAEQYGGGASMGFGAKLNATDTTLSGNKAPFGGAINADGSISLDQVSWPQWCLGPDAIVWHPADV